MKCYLVQRSSQTLDWCQDRAMVVIAEDVLHAERCARVNSANFRKVKLSDLSITEVDMNREHVVLIDNVGA